MASARILVIGKRGKCIAMTVFEDGSTQSFITSTSQSREFKDGYINVVSGSDGNVRLRLAANDSSSRRRLHHPCGIEWQSVYQSGRIGPAPPTLSANIAQLLAGPAHS